MHRWDIWGSATEVPLDLPIGLPVLFLNILLIRQSLSPSQSGEVLDCPYRSRKYSTAHCPVERVA